MDAGPAPLDLTVIVPAFEEEARIGGTLASLQHHLAPSGLRYEVVVAADGADGTAAVVDRWSRTDPRISVLASEERRGKGRAVREAVGISRGAVVGYIDADDKVDLRRLADHVALVAAGSEVVVGSRRHPSSSSSGAGLARRLGSRAFGWWVRRVTGLAAPLDTQCGYKLFSAAAARRLFAHQRIDGYLFDVELLVLARRAAMEVAEVPVRWRGDDDTRSPLLAGVPAWTMELLRIRRAWGSARQPGLTLPGRGCAGERVPRATAEPRSR